MNSNDLLDKPTAIVWPTILEAQSSVDASINATKGAEEMLLKAAYENNSAAVKLALAGGVDPNCWDSNGLTPLHIAAARGHHLLVDMLQGQGAMVDSRAFGGFTPLHMAAFSGSPECTLLLLDGTADPNPKDTYGLTPLKVATQLQHEKVVSLLKSRGGHD
ncbi:ankyrin repeat domain-containing protein 65 isoform X1 [Halyomorpha halys]|uniref:ankyrin repeat domain-containing protein 65 isoform X1 n=1 Tax=Halyomorpha halys TaxID=286706 RepID=UPI0006D507F9|nr:ankyrin repeat domain-containing protein 65-like isoform X1 [Halyomorpha halys]XP_014292392.1 ankyrin repeat domain-containing protein 65-like isoform X1 [Halyomorpha halys]XP_014292393.1 ankyrin repeat domain-containing protein 65-like isoform X1 [Halyomorpha halys]